MKPFATLFLAASLPTVVYATPIYFENFTLNKVGRADWKAQEKGRGKATVSVVNPLTMKGSSATITYGFEGVDMAGVLGLSSMEVTLLFELVGGSGELALNGNGSMGSTSDPRQRGVLTKKGEGIRMQCASIRTNLGDAVVPHFLGFDKIGLGIGDSAPLRAGNFDADDRYDLVVEGSTMLDQSSEKGVVRFSLSPSFLVRHAKKSQGDGFGLRKFEFSIDFDEGKTLSNKYYDRGVQVVDQKSENSIQVVRREIPSSEPVSNQGSTKNAALISFGGITLITN
jgi:hypothetical protein